MSKLRVSSFAVSIDGFGAGPDQDLQNPLGVSGVALMDWFFPTRTWRHISSLQADVFHDAIRPVLLGRGEALFNGIDLPALGYESVKHVAGDRATHVYLRRRAT